MSKLTIHTKRCKGCGLCIRECPRKALSQTNELNEKGYKIVVVDDEKCVGCGICYEMCPDCVFELGV